MGLLGQKECACNLARPAKFPSMRVRSFHIVPSHVWEILFPYSLDIKICCSTFGFLHIWEVINNNSVRLCMSLVIMRSSIFPYILVSFTFLILWTVCWSVLRLANHCPGRYKYSQKHRQAFSLEELLGAYPDDRPKMTTGKQIPQFKF